MRRVDLKNNKIVIEMSKEEWQKMNAVFCVIDRQPDNYVVDWDLNADPTNPNNLTPEKFSVLWEEWLNLIQNDPDIYSPVLKCIETKNDSIVVDMSGKKWNQVSDLIGILARLDSDYDIEWDVTPDNPEGLTEDEFVNLWDKWLDLTKDDTPRYNVEDDL
ncbi:MAG: hypothetical protein ACLFU1_08105 [Alphaproteobacteria bacterium]